MSYDYVAHWGSSTFTVEGVQGEWLELVRDHLIPGSVVDVGCAGGRFVRAFDNHDYLGVDISPVSIATARTAFPDKRFEVRDIVTWEPERSYDNIFTWTVLEHIPPEYIEEVIRKLKDYSKNLVIVEPIPDGTQWATHCFPHDYDALLSPKVKKQIHGLIHLHQAEGNA